ncbi:unnamed protein product [Lymnaea stagnalis]|uniref:Uncharacterized protein n=1 Tax=Lymnaea stagnalis TaxID=6523 RepID=A0AAV2HX90_LYMST
MAPFVVTQYDLLVIALAAHSCVLIHLILARLVDCAVTAASFRCSLVQTLADLHGRRPNLLARVLTEQLTLWTLIVAIFIALTYTSVSSLPFSHQPNPYPSFLLGVILHATVARHLFAATRILLVKETAVTQSGTASVATAGHSGYRHLDFIYNILVAASCLVSLGYKENLLFGVTMSFMEVGSTPLECCRLVKLARRNSESYKKLTVVCCVVCVLSRAALPVLLLTIASLEESPFVMDSVTIATSVACGCYFVFYFSLLLYQSIRRVIKSFSYAPRSPVPYSYVSPVPFSIHDYPEMLSNDIQSDHGMLDAEVLGNRYKHFKGLNYGFLRSYDNRNLYSSLLGKEKDKLNVTKRKENPKYLLLYKMPRDTHERTVPGDTISLTSERSSSHVALLSDTADDGQDEVDIMGSGDSKLAGWMVAGPRIWREEHDDVKRCDTSESVQTDDHSPLAQT